MGNTSLLHNLRESLYVDADINKAKTLPPWTFTSKEFLKFELETLFSKTWLLIPNKGNDEEERNGRPLAYEARVRGAQVPFTFLSEPLFLWRDYREQRLHCYLNICTHAWYPLVEGRARNSMVTCGQHGRKFHCEGKCKAHSGFSQNEITDEFHLRQFAIEEWQNLLFMSFGRPTAPLCDVLAEVNNSFAKIPFNKLEQRFHGDEVRIVPGNWKQYVINFLDKYHIGYIHPPPHGLSDVVDISSYCTELFEHSCLQWAYAKDPRLGLNPSYIPDRFHDPENPSRRVFALWWFIFPSTVFMLFPWGLATYSYIPLREDPTKTIFYWYQYSLDEEKYQTRNELWLHRQINDEDVDAMSKLNNGLHSKFASCGQFSLKNEKAPHWFHHLVYKYCTE